MTRVFYMNNIKLQIGPNFQFFIDKIKLEKHVHSFSVRHLFEWFNYMYPTEIISFLLFIHSSKCLIIEIIMHKSISTWLTILLNIASTPEFSFCWIFEIIQQLPIGIGQMKNVGYTQNSMRSPYIHMQTLDIYDYIEMSNQKSNFRHKPK
jgi:hypothetical protein